MGSRSSTQPVRSYYQSVVCKFLDCRFEDVSTQHISTVQAFQEQSKDLDVTSKCIDMIVSEGKDCVGLQILKLNDELEDVMPQKVYMFDPSLVSGTKLGYNPKIDLPDPPEFFILRFTKGN